MPSEVNNNYVLDLLTDYRTIQFWIEHAPVVIDYAHGGEEGCYVVDFGELPWYLKTWASGDYTKEFDDDVLQWTFGDGGVEQYYDENYLDDEIFYMTLHCESWDDYVNDDEENYHDL